MKIQKSGIFSCIAYAAVLFSAQGCDTQDAPVSSDQSATPSDPKAERVRDYIRELGIADHQVTSFENYFVVDKDILFDKNKVYGQTGPLAKGAQYSASLVDLKVARNIRVRVNANMPAGSVAEVDAALKVLNWTYSGFHFERVTSTNQHILISFQLGGCPGQGDACAPYPSGGLPGSYVTIASPHWGGWGTTLHTRSLIHELMHCIGFVHNAEWNENTSTWYAPTGTLVPNTPGWQSEENFSIMHVADWSFSSRHIGVDNANSRFDNMAHQYLYPYRYSQRSGDINGDGKTDLVRLRGSDNAVSFRLANSNLGFGSVINSGNFGDQNGQYLMADIDGDKKSDLLFAKGGSIFMRKSTGTGFNAQTTLATGFGSTTAGGTYQTLDFNGDGKTDLMYISYVTQTISIRVSTGTGLSGTAYSKNFGDAAGQYFTGDFNGDGKDDIMCAKRPTQTLADPSTLQPHHSDITLSTGTGFGATTPLMCGDCFGQVSWGGQYFSADFNKDGKDDIIFYNANGGTNGQGAVVVALSTGSGIGSIIGPANLGSPGSQIYVGDMNGDGRADIFSATRIDDTFRVQLSNGTSMGGSVHLLGGGTMGSMKSGDQYL